MNKFWMNTLTTLVWPAVAMSVLGGCLSESSGPQPNSGLSETDPTNSAPIIQGNPAPAITIGQTYSFVPVASDPDGDTLTFAVTNLPSWASFNTETGEVSGQPTLTDEGIFSSISISASDGTQSSSLNSFSIQVTQSSLGTATLSLQAPAFNTDGTPFTDLRAYCLYFGTSQGVYPNEIYIDSAGISDYVVENLAPATYYFVATVINSAGMESGYSNEISRVVD